MIDPFRDRHVRGRAAAAAWLLAGALLLSGGPASAQFGVWTSVFGGAAPAPEARQRPPEEEAPDETPVPSPLKKLPGGKTAASAEEAATRDVPYDTAEALRRSLNPPPGTLLSYTHFPDSRLGRRLGGSVVQQATAGTRLGGGYDYPSPEAITIDPRDILDARVQYLSDPKQPYGN